MHSLKKRYLVKLAVNFIGLPISILIQSIIPRALGPSNYGDFNYLTNFFRRVFNFLDTGTSIGFYTKLSQRPDDSGLIKSYWYMVFTLILFLIILLSVTFILRLNDSLWPDQKSIYIWLALFFGLLSWISEIISKIIDAYGLTIKGEILKLFQKLIGLALIIGLFVSNYLNLTILFYYNYVILILISIGWIQVLKKNNIQIFPTIILKIHQIKNYFAELYKYSYPLITLSIVILVSGIFDIWLLQKFGGSIEQGFYGLSYKIASIYFLVASSLTQLIMREFSIAFYNNDTTKISQLFNRYIPLIYAIIAFFTVFLAFNSEKISYIFGGSEFVDAKTAITIMAFYPLHQTYGQLSGSLFYATNKTKIYSNISIITSVLGVFLTLFLIFPTKYYGLGLGATGLAYKMVVIQFIGVNLQLWYNTRFLKISFYKFLNHQFYTIVFFMIISYLALHAGNIMSADKLFSIVLGGLIYSFLSVLFIYFFPAIIAMSRNEMNQRVIDVRIYIFNKIVKKK